MNQRTVQGNWLKVQRQSTNRTTKSNSQKWKGSCGEFRRVLQSGGKSIGRTVPPGQRKCKKGAAEMGKLEASSLSIFQFFEKFS